jgi:hypothetical protein
MTPTAAELLSDPAFLEKRMREQLEYMSNYDCGYQQLMGESRLFNVPPGLWRLSRYHEIMTSANSQLAFYREQREKILNNKAR